MKKISAVLLSLVSVICIAFSLTACGENPEDKKAEEGTLYTVTEAYEKGYIIYQHVLSIAYHRNGSDEGNKPVINIPILPKNPEQLSAQTEESIKHAYIDTFLQSYDEAELSDVTILHYYGTYKGCVAVMISGYFDYTEAEWTEEVDGIKINYNDGNRIYIFVPDSIKRDLSADDIATTRLGHEPYLEEDFEDNAVCVILRSKYDYLTEISFEDLKIVENVSRISYISDYLNEYTYEDGKIPLGKFRMFKIVLEEYSKEKVLEVIELVETLDMVLCATPDYIEYAVDD